MTTAQGQTPPSPTRIDRLARRARAAIFVEQGGPAIGRALGPLALLTAAHLFGLFATAPVVASAAALLAALAATGALLWRDRARLLLPTRDRALDRLEREARLDHDPLRALEDAAFAGDASLWSAHVDRQQAAAAKIRAFVPRPDLDGADPHGLRYAVFALLLIGLVAAGKDAGSRLAGAFFPRDPAAPMGVADLWIEPPAFTGKPPIQLLRGADPLPGKRAAIVAPAGSALVAQPASSLGVRLSMNGVAAKASPEEDGRRVRVLLEQSGEARLSARGRTARWRIDVIPDKPPLVALEGAPTATDDRRLEVKFVAADDYGLASAELHFSLVPDQKRALDEPDFDRDALAETRVIPIEDAGGASGPRRIRLDLQSDPWAGYDVTAVVVVADGAGQTATSLPERFTLPTRAFLDPLARAVVEQRRTLAVAPSTWRRAQTALNGLTLGPQHFFDEATDYLLLRTAMWRVRNEAARDPAKTVADLWPLALQLENEALDLAKQRLDAAKKELREALARGAPDSEIDRLTENLRAALQQFLAAMAQSGAPPNADAEPADETIDAADLDAMLNSIRDLARSGARGAAEQALKDLDDILDNLRMAGQSGSGSGGGSPGGSGQESPGAAAGAAGDLIGRERDLADKTYARGQGESAGAGDLADQQNAIRNDLAKLIERVDRDPAADPEGSASRALRSADAAMEEAASALRSGDLGAASAAMRRSIEKLREGAGEMAQAAGAAAKAAQGGGAPRRDPLGRPIGEGVGAGVDLPAQSDAQRAREIVEEIRRRLSTGGRSEEEIRYLERLLERF